MITLAAIGYGMLAIVLAGNGMVAASLICGAIWLCLVVLALLTDDAGPA